MSKTHIVIHHSATPVESIKDTIKGVNSAHKNRGFPKSELGYHVGYHYMIDFFGNAVQTRMDHEIGAHCREQKMNYKSIGICLIGNFVISKPTNDQIEKLIETLTYLCTKYKIPVENIKYHGEFKPTACCGKNLINSMSYIKNAVKDRLHEKQKDWKDVAKEWAMDNGVITKWENLPFTEEQTIWLAEVLRKFKNLR